MENNIRQIRKEKKMTQEKLASIVGVSRETIVKLESGKHNPSFELIDSIALVLDVTVYDLMTGCRSEVCYKDAIRAAETEVKERYYDFVAAQQAFFYD